MSGSVTIPNYNYLSDVKMEDPTLMARNYTDLQQRQLALTQDQAKQRWSDILAANTDANGTINFPAARAAAAKDPLGMHGMMAGTSATSPLITDQNSQAVQHLGLANSVFSGLAVDPSDANVDFQAHRLALAGVPQAQIDQEVQQFKALDPAGRVAQAKQLLLSGLDAAGKVGQVAGTPYRENLGGSVQGGVQGGGLFGGGSLSPGSGAQPTTMSPEEANRLDTVPYPKFLEDGKTPHPLYGQSYQMRHGDRVRLAPSAEQAGGGTPGLPGTLRINPANRTAPNQPAAPGTAPTVPTGPPSNTTNVPGPPGGAAGPVTPYAGPGMGGAVSAAPAPAATPPPATVTPAPPVAPAGPPRVPTAALQGGVPVASQNFIVPQTGAPSAPGPAVPGYVAAIQAGIQNARANPSAGSTATAGAGPTPEAGWGTAPGTPGSYGTVTPRPAPAAAPPATPAAPTPYFGTSPNPADIKEMEGRATQNVAGFQAITDQAVQSRNRSAILGNMLGDTTKFATGALASRFETLRNVAIRLGLPVDTQAQASQEGFNKNAAQLANAQGAGSDNRMQINVQANPHQELSPQGVDLMIRQLQGNEDYLQARAKIAQSSGETNIRNFEANIGSNLDPRAFQFDRMTPPQRQEYVKGLSQADRAAVQRSYNWAHGQGLVGG